MSTPIKKTAKTNIVLKSLEDSLVSREMYETKIKLLDHMNCK